MSIARTLARNICFNWLGHAVQIAVTFFLTPLILHTLGDARYGIWSLVMALTGYYGLIDLGFRASLTQYIARYVATKDYPALQRIISTAWFILAGCATVLLAASPILGWLAPRIFEMPEAAEGEVWWCVLIVGTAIAMQFVFFPFSAVLPAMQRYDLASSIGVITRLVTAGTTIFCLKMGYGLVGIALSTAGGNMLDYALRACVALRIMPQFKISYRLVNRKSFGEFMHFGFWSSFITWSTRLQRFTAPLIIGFFLGMAAIAPFEIANRCVAYLAQILAQAATPFYPMMTELDAQGDRAALRKLYLAGSKLILLLAFSAATVALVWADDFLTLWLGERFVKQPEFASPTLLLRWILVGMVFNYNRLISTQVFSGMRRLNVLAKIAVTDTIAKLALAITLIHSLGLLGVVVGMAVPSILIGVLVPLVVTNRVLGISWRQYLRAVWLRPLLVALVLPWPVLLGRAFLPATSWPRLFIQGGLGVVSACVVIVVFGLNENERNRFAYGTLGRLKDRLSWNGLRRRISCVGSALGKVRKLLGR